ncbi:FAD-binding domain-containing protein [Aspergillus sclerotioniger CBS 115572]|uniref:D-lactate dehydrogenase (cytochrome) n=1 Tax=Aspergillus sclerotioniger CBS 115572 TaxID=1450535 RepID=A0A317X381_9EURO|nr:FAD-binding domain-containing protein [Aspergillus sclerotioniger CBS 115572]PWY93016.1 FAD-binding domain-containing protein [Aspergillus sclerotioniger CBS 115572]
MRAWQTTSLRACARRSSLNARRVQRPPFSSRGRHSNFSTQAGNAPRKSATLPILGSIVATAAVTLLASEAWRAKTDTQQVSAGAKYADGPTMLRAVEEIKQVIGDENVSVDSDDIEAHGYSEWSTSNTTARPVAVFSPASTEEVSQIAKICTKYKVPMVPFGAGSSVEGNFAAPHSGVCIDLSRMNQVIELYEQDMNVTVQAGVRWTDLNEQIKSTGLFLPMDPSPTAYVGGMVATNCSGTNAMRYGTMKDWVVNLTVVLADGTILKTKRRPRKSSAGYNLNALFTGSEGTLGIITEATLKLAIIPEESSVGIATFPTVGDATAAASKLIRDGVPLAALEFMDDVQMKIINQNGGAGGRFWSEAPTLFLKFTGTRTGITDSIHRTRTILSKNKSNELVFANSREEGDNLWAARKQSLWAILAVRPEGTEIWSTDVAVPISRLAEIVELSKTESSNLGLFSTVLGHVGDGNFHQAVMYNPQKPEEYQAVKACVSRMMKRALEMEGTVSGEHGIGIGKKAYLEEELGTSTMEFMRGVKRSVDPYWLMNPGKVFDEYYQGRT